MGEEWRLLIEFDADGALAPAAEEIVAELGEEIGLHRADDSLVAYADTSQAANAAERRLREALEKRGLAHLESEVEHWSHDDQEWQDESSRPSQAEDDEDEEPETDSWTVEVSLPHHHEAKQLADQLRDEGWDASFSWHTVEVATRSREDAESLVAELGARTPDATPEIMEK